MLAAAGFDPSTLRPKVGDLDHRTTVSCYLVNFLYRVLFKTGVVSGVENGPANLDNVTITNFVYKENLIPAEDEFKFDPVSS